MDVNARGEKGLLCMCVKGRIRRHMINQMSCYVYFLKIVIPRISLGLWLYIEDYVIA